MARVQCLVASAKAYSATTVFPALVWAATKTEWPCRGQRRTLLRLKWGLHPTHINGAGQQDMLLKT